MFLLGDWRNIVVIVRAYESHPKRLISIVRVLDNVLGTNQICFS